MEELDEDELIAADQNRYVKITELNLILADRDKRIDALKNEVKRINEEIKNEERNKLDVTRTLQTELDDRSEQIIQLESNIDRLQVSNKSSKGELEIKYNAEIDEMRMKQERELQDIISQRESIESEIKKVKEYETNKLEKQQILHQLRKEYEFRFDKIKRIRLEEEEEISKRKEKLREEFRQKLELDRERAKLEAEKRISEIDKNIQEQNARLDEEVNLQNDVIEFIEKQKETVFEENIGYKKDLDANIDTVIDYAKKQYEQNLKIKDLKGKIGMLEKSLSQIVQDFEKEKELLKYQNEQIEQEQDEDILNFKEQIRLKEREIKNIKALCQMILDQRSDVEQFFLEAIEQVKEEVKKRKEQNKDTSLPDIHRSHSRPSNFQRSENSFEASNINQNSRIKLSDLDWEDRERVLRLLFSKMNSGVPWSNWRNPQSNVYASGNDMQIEDNSIIQETGDDDNLLF